MRSDAGGSRYLYNAPQFAGADSRVPAGEDRRDNTHFVENEWIKGE